MELSDDELDRYARHIILKEIGGAGQLKLLGAKVLVVGAGGIGAPALLYLAAAGVGALGVIDHDQVALSNLQRQIIHKTSDVGEDKTLSAARALHALNPDISVVQHDYKLNAQNVAGLVGDYDLILDGCDNFETRFLAADQCLKQKKPLVSAAVGPFDGQLSVFKGYASDLPCYRCYVPDIPPGGGGTCADQGIVGALTGVMGSLAALEAIKEITGAGESLAGKLLIFDALSTRFRTVKLRKDPACPACGG